MGWKTISGTLAANAGASGLIEWSAGDGLAASDINANYADGQTPSFTDYRAACWPGVRAPQTDS